MEDLADDYQQDVSTLLSTKIKKLKERNKLSQTSEMQNPKTFTFNQNVSPLKKSKSLKQESAHHKENKVKRRQKKKKKQEQRQKSNSSLLSISKILKKKGITLFQKTGVSGRRTNYNQVKDVPLSQFTGQGLLILPNKKKYQGQWIQGKMIGNVKMTYPNGNIYYGETYEYEKHGRGQLTFDNKKYVGQFSANQFHGEGRLYDNEGNLLYDGLWRRGQKWDK